MVIVAKYFQLRERREKQISINWKIGHVVLFTCIAISGWFSTRYYEKLIMNFAGSCILYARIIWDHTLCSDVESGISMKAPPGGCTGLGSNVKNKSIPFIDVNLSDFLPMTTCTFFESFSLASTLFGIFWGVFFLLLSRGGGGSKGEVVRHSWLMIVPALVFSVSFLVIYFIVFLITILGVNSFCKACQEVTLDAKCGTNMNYLPVQFTHHSESFYEQYLKVILYTSFGCLTWLLQAAVLVIRILFMIDFEPQFVQIIVKEQQIGEPFHPGFTDTQISKFKNTHRAKAAPIKRQIERDYFYDSKRAKTMGFKPDAYVPGMTYQRPKRKSSAEVVKSIIKETKALEEDRLRVRRQLEAMHQKAMATKQKTQPRVKQEFLGKEKNIGAQVEKEYETDKNMKEEEKMRKQNRSEPVIEKAVRERLRKHKEMLEEGEEKKQPGEKRSTDVREEDEKKHVDDQKVEVFGRPAEKTKMQQLAERTNHEKYRSTGEGDKEKEQTASEEKDRSVKERSQVRSYSLEEEEKQKHELSDISKEPQPAVTEEKKPVVQTEKSVRFDTEEIRKSLSEDDKSPLRSRKRKNRAKRKTLSDLGLF